MKRKVLSFLLGAILIFNVFGVSSFAQEKSFKDDPKEIKRLMGLGFSKKEIQDFTQEEYDKLQGLEGKVISENENYYKIEIEKDKDGKVKVKKTTKVSKEEALKEAKEYKEKKLKQIKEKHPEISTDIKNEDLIIATYSSELDSDTTETSWMKLDSTVTDIGYGQYGLKTSFEWLSVPLWSLKDVVGMTHSNWLSVEKDSAYLVYRADAYDDWGFDHVRTVTYGEPDQKSPTGQAFIYDFKKSENGYDLVNSRGYMYMRVTNSNDNYNKAHMYGHYSHQTAAASISISISTGDLSVSPSFAFSDATDTECVWDLP